MRDEMMYVKLGDEQYPIVFNLNVMEEIQEEYGSVSKWGEIVENNHLEPKIKDLKKGLLIMINEGVEIENEKGLAKEPLTSKKIGRLINKGTLKELIEKVKNITINSTKVDNNVKNV